MGIYRKYYGLTTDPFHITPDPSVLLLTESHRKAMGAIGYGVRDRKGFVVVTGEVGVGKTTALRACLDDLPADETKVIYIFDPKISSDALYATIIASLDKGEFSNSERAVDAIHGALLEYYRAGVNVILAVDEAQHMPAETLESLRLLSNLETTSQKLLQIILVGQPELNQVLAAYSMRQLDQRIAVRAHMVPLTFSQSIRYIRHRLALSGWSGQDDLFTLPAACYLAWHAHGVPRKLNIHCDNALVNGYGMDAKRITLRIARLALVDLPKRRLKAYWTAAGLVGLALIACGVAFAAAPETTRSWWTGLGSLGTEVIAKVDELKSAGAQAVAGVPSRPTPPSTATAPTGEVAAVAVGRPPADPLQAVPAVKVPDPPVADAAPRQDALVLPPAPSPAAKDPAVQAVVVPAALTNPPPDLPAPTTVAPAAIVATPVDPPAPPPAAETDKPPVRSSRPLAGHTVTAQTGDTLIRLCTAAYGHCTKDLLLSLAKANQIAEPDVLLSGKVLAIPPARSSAVQRASQESENH